MFTGSGLQWRRTLSFYEIWPASNKVVDGRSGHDAVVGLAAKGRVRGSPQATAQRRASVLDAPEHGAMIEVDGAFRSSFLTWC